MRIVKRATLKKDGSLTFEIFLHQIERGVFRWLDGHGLAWDGKDWLDEETAIAQARVAVETDPDFVGVDLTVFAMDPTPEERAAKRLAGGDLLPAEGIAEIIAQETNISALLDATETLLAYCMTRRPAFARALYPTTKAGAPRDMVLDGLLLTAIEACEKAKQANYGNLKKPLLTPISAIVQATRKPEEPGRIQ